MDGLRMAEVSPSATVERPRLSGDVTSARTCSKEAHVLSRSAVILARSAAASSVFLP